MMKALLDPHDKHANLAQVGIPQYLLEKLIATGELHSNECRCLNSVAKHVIWQTLLNTSVKLEY